MGREDLVVLLSCVILANSNTIIGVAAVAVELHYIKRVLLLQLQLEII